VFLGIRRVLAPLVAAVALATTALTVAAPTAAYAESTSSMESQFIAKLNAARQANGQSPYAVLYDLTAVARSQSAAMASHQSLYHNPSLTTAVHSWQAVGENVGEGPTVGDIHVAFMNSPEHRANILDHDFTQVGVGVSIDKNGIVWVTEDFREPLSAAAPVTHTASHSSGTHSAPVSTSASTSSSASPTWSSAAPTAHPAQPRPKLSPRAILLQRLRHLRHHHHRISPHTDPVAQSFDYVANLSRLAG